MDSRVNIITLWRVTCYFVGYHNIITDDVLWIRCSGIPLYNYIPTSPMYYISENPKTYSGHNNSTSIIRLIRHNKEVSKEAAVQIQGSMVKKWEVLF